MSDETTTTSGENHEAIVVHEFHPGPVVWACGYLRCSAPIGEPHADDCPYRHIIHTRRPAD